MNTTGMFIKDIPLYAKMAQKIRENDTRIKNIKKNIDRDLIQRYARDKEFMERSKSFMRKGFNGYSDIRWHILFASLSGIKSPEYIPFDLWRTMIEPQINPLHLAKAYCDKNIYDKILNYSMLPKTIGRIYNNKIYDDQYIQISKNQLLKRVENFDNKIVLKPALHSGRGRNMKVIYKNKLQSYLENISFDQSWIIQEYVEQLPELSRYHEPSLNTIRIMTVNIDGEYNMLMAELKMGTNGNMVDNVGAGGIFVGVSPDGYLKSYGFDSNYNKHYHHPNSKLKFEKTKIKSFNKIVELATLLHRYLYNFTVVSWDIAVKNDTNPVVIEYNLFNQTLDMQFNSGPLFGEYTDYVIAKVNVPKYTSLLFSNYVGLKRHIQYLKMKR